MSTIEVKVPDIGDFTDVPVIEVFVKAGDAVAKEDSLVTLESDKATMDVPSPVAGTVKEVKVKVGDKLSEGSSIALVEAAAAAAPSGATPAAAAAAPEPTAAPAPARASAASAEVAPSAARQPAAADTKPTTAEPAPEKSASPAPIDAEAFKAAHASPSVRKFARELGVDLAHIKGSGPKGRILQQDVQDFVKGVMRGTGAPQRVAGGMGGSVSGGATLNLLP